GGRGRAPALLHECARPAAIISHAEGAGAFQWAVVGVLDESDGAVYLFDPARGQPLPGPGGRGVATFAQVRANPAQLDSWRTDPKAPWPVTAEQLKQAGRFLAPPPS